MKDVKKIRVAVYCGNSPSIGVLEKIKDLIDEGQVVLQRNPAFFKKNDLENGVNAVVVFPSLPNAEMIADAYKEKSIEVVMVDEEEILDKDPASPFDDLNKGEICLALKEKGIEFDGRLGRDALAEILKANTVAEPDKE